MNNLLTIFKNKKPMEKKSYLFFFLVPILFFSCTKEDSTNEVPITNQDITVLVTYNGHIQTYDYSQHDVKVYLSTSSETLIVKETSKSLNELKSKGATVTIKNVEPGDYFIDATWDFNDDGASADEPRSYSIPVTVDGKDKVSLTVDLLDQNDITKKGWVEGYLYYNGNDKDSHHLYVTIYGPNYYRSVKKVTLYPVNLANLGKYGYLSNNVDRGTYVAIDAFWDKNDNSQYDKGIDPYCRDLSGFFINAGMGLKKDMTLLYESN
jgi:hypothetical protein